MNRAKTRTLVAVVGLAICGCGQQVDRWKAARPATTPASGVVTYQGEPLEGAIVVFHPTSPDGVGASALTDDEGKFELKTFPPELGAVPGEYSVSIMKTNTPEPAEGAEQVDDPEPVHVISLIPDKYSIPTTSGLSAEIPDNGTDALEFDLSK